MKHRLLHILPLLLLIGATSIAWAQGYDEATDDNFHAHHLTKTQEVAMLPYLRINDIAWATMIWRTVDFREKFNQYFYFPQEEDGIHGRKNIAYTLWDAIVENKIPIYQDDECLIPYDNETFVRHVTKGDTIILEVEDDEGSVEYKTIVVPQSFHADQVVQLYLKEYWYIDKQSTRQWVRYLSMAIGMNRYRHSGDEDIFQGTFPMFWVPMQSVKVRRLLAQHEAYLENNIAHIPSWNDIFTTRKFEGFVTRESNRFNRTISSYLTGEDALLESERIDDMLLNISQDMWEF